MEEHAPGAAEAEGLQLGQGRAGERRRALGQVEDVAVPVQDHRAGSEGAEDRVAGIEDLDRGEADLLPLPRPHRSAERAGQELGAQADAEDRDLAADRLGQPRALAGQSRVEIDLVDVHRPAHEHGAGDLVVVGQRLAGQRFDGAHGERAAGVEDPVRRLPGRMLDGQQGLGPELIATQANRATVGAMAKLGSVAFFKPEVRPGTLTGAQLRGAAAIGALAVGAAAVGGFAIGRLSVGRLAVRRASFGKLEVEELEVGKLTVREGWPPA